MNRSLTIALVLAGMAHCAVLGQPTDSNSVPAPTPAAALERLREGNQRFVEGRSQPRDLVAQRQATAAVQKPFAVILSCLDSRGGPEQVFDQGIGEIMSARVAGNVLNDDILGSMEFACQVIGTPLIAVIGHSQCGAVIGAAQDVKLGHVTGVLTKIRPAVAAHPAASGANPAEPKRIDAITEANVRLVLQQIPERSPILAKLVAEGKVRLVGGVHDLASGRVTFLE